MVTVNDRQIATDKEGYLANLEDWSPSVAEFLARQEKLLLTPDHWQLIELVRRFYETYDHAPAMRPLVKYTARELGQDKGNSIYLMTLFPGNPAKLLSKIAGLPRPTNCL